MSDTANIIPSDRTDSSENIGATNGEEKSENLRPATINENNTSKGKVLPIQKETVEKWKNTLSFLAPLFACVVINIIAGIFYMSFSLVLVSVVRRAFDEDAEMVAQVQNTFRVFTGLSAAACAPLMIKYGFRKVAIGGSVLLIFSCISSSLASTADILAIPYGFMGGVAFGLIRTTGIVATLDFLHTRPVLALFLSYLCFVIGNITGIIVFITEMTRYITSSRRWPNAMRIFEVIAVVGLLAGSFLQKNSLTQQNVPKVFKHPPFYILLVIRIVASVGLTIIVPATLSLPPERRFPSFVYHPLLSAFLITFVSQLITNIVLVIIRKFRKEEIKKVALLSFGIVIAVVGTVTMFHQLALVQFWILAVFGALLGVTQVFSQTMVPLALIQTTGKNNYKLVLPLLVSVQELGGLIGGGSMAKIVSATSSVNGALYYAGVTLIIAGAGAIVGWLMFGRWAPLEDETISVSFKNTYRPADDNQTDEDVDMQTD